MSKETKIQEWRDGLSLRLSLAREMRGITQHDLAEALGCAQSFVAQCEKGMCKPSVNKLFEICFQLGISPGKLFGGIGEEK